MTPLTYTLLADGTSDRCLMPLINAAIRDAPAAPAEFVDQFADPAGFAGSPESLAERMREAVAAYPCQLLIVHLDAEKEPAENRYAEVTRAAAEVADLPRRVAVVPVRMSEAWLLCDEPAIRRAAGKPNGDAPLDLPPRPDAVLDPKTVLRDALVTASGKSGRHLRKFRGTLPRRVHLVADYQAGLDPLRSLPEFARFEADLRDVLAALA